MLYIFCLAFIFLVISQGSAQEGNEGKILQDVSNKVDDLWSLYGAIYPTKNNNDTSQYAICILQPNPKLSESELKITGKVYFKQEYPKGMLEAYFDLTGFPPDSNSARAIHIHTFGDLSNGCDSAGGHYNPFSVNHPGHPGDFGNFIPVNGVIQKHLTNLPPKLFGPLSVLGKSVVVHKLPDDLGKGNNQASLENGNAGTRLACCVIGSTGNTGWNNIMQAAGSQ